MSFKKFLHFSVFASKLILFTSGCATTDRAALALSSSTVYRASYEAETERNWNLFKETAPANVKLLEALLHLSPNNLNLLALAIKGHSGLAFAIHETLWLEDQLKGRSNSVHRDMAIYHYSRAIEYAQRYLKRRGVNYADLKRLARQENGIIQELNRRLSSRKKRELEAIVFAGQAIAGFVNLNRDNMLVMGELPVAVGLFDWVCSKDPEINHGGCSIFYGAYHAGRPVMLGGDPVKGKQYFKDLMEKHPHNWLAYVSYLQYYAIPLRDQAEFQRISKKMDQFREKHYQSLTWNPLSNKEDHEFQADESLGIFQAMAIKRFEIISRYTDQIF